MIRRLTTEEFIRRSKRAWGEDKFDYTNTIYKNRRTKLIICCPIHGNVKVFPEAHLRKEHSGANGCPKCGVEKRSIKGKNFLLEVGTSSGGKPLTQEEVIKQFIARHGDTYNYAKVKYKGDQENIIITCRKHGDFLQLPSNHKKGAGCKECANDFLRLDLKGQKYGDLKVIRLASKKEVEKYGLKHYTTHWMVQCVCGRDPYPISSSNLRFNLVKSCKYCAVSGWETYSSFLDHPTKAESTTSIYLVEVKNKYYKFGIAYDVIKRSLGDYTQIFYERLLPRAKARAVELISLQWTLDKRPKLSEEWLKWHGSSELRENLDIDKSIDMLEHLCDESEDYDWKEFWALYELDKIFR